MPKRASSSPLAQVKRSLRQLDLKARKSLGQHFLVDEAALEDIVLAAELTMEDVVIEVGPGLGVLTGELAGRSGEVIAIELDTKLASFLEHRFSSFSNVAVINADILEVRLSQLVEGRGNYKVVANLPYYITSPVLRHFLEASVRPSLMVVTVQKEVGEVITARPGEMTLLAISVQLYSKPTIISYVPASSFYPPPKVDSVIVRFDLLPEPAVKVADVNGFFKVVRCGFSSPRKQLRNSLAQGLGVVPAVVASLLEEAGIEPQRRAETLCLEEWERLYESLVALKGSKVLC